MSKQFFIFLLTGGAAAVVSFGSRILYNLWTSFSTAVILASLTGMLAAFILAKLFVFTQSQQPLHRSAFSFVFVYLLAMLQTWLVSMLFGYYVLPAVGMKAFVPEIAHTIGMAVPAFTSYLAHKHWSFR